MARRGSRLVSWPPALGLDLPLALGAALAVLGLVALSVWLPGPAQADGPWQASRCSPTPCTDVRDVAVAQYSGAEGETAARTLAFLVGGAGRLWRSEDGGETNRMIDTYLSGDLPSVSVVPGTSPTPTVYVAINGDNHILTSLDGGLTFSQVKVGLPMEQRAVCGLGPDRAAVFGRVGTFPATQWFGPNNSNGIIFFSVDVNGCDTFINPFTGDINGLKMVEGGYSGIFGFRGPNDPLFPGLFFTSTTVLGGDLLDVDCENYADDEIILAVGERRTSAVTSAVCRAAGRDQEGKGVVIQLNLTGPSTITSVVILRSDLPFTSVGFWGDYGAVLRQDGMVYMTWDRGNFWQATPSPTGAIPRRVAVVPWGTARGPRVLVVGQGGSWYYELPTPDVAIGKEGPAQVAAGGEVTYSLRVTNTTPLTARGVMVADTLSVDHGVAAAVPSPILRAGRSTFWLLGTLGGNESRTITYTVLLTDTLQGGELVTNRAEVTATGDLNPANNTAVVTATVQGGGGGGQADMEATKAGPQALVAGQPFTYTLLAVNVGSEKATDVSLIDALSAELRFLGADITPSLVLTPTIRWLAGEVGPGAVARIAVRVELSGTVAVGTVLTNALSVSAADDANPLNDMAQVTSTVATVAPTPSAAQTVSGTIGALGGTLASQEGAYLVIVPRRAFSTPLSLSFTPASPPPATEGSIPVAAFSLSGTLGTASVETLDRPITVEVKYSDAGLTEAQERRLTLFRKTDSGAFIALSTQVDTVNNIARATIDHLSDFILQALNRFVYLPFLARERSGGW